MTRVPPPVIFPLCVLFVIGLRVATGGDFLPEGAAVSAGAAFVLMGTVPAGDAAVRFIRAGTNIDPPGRRRCSFRTASTASAAIRCTWG